MLEKREERFLKILAHTKSEIRAGNTEEDLEVVDLDQLASSLQIWNCRYNSLSLLVFFCCGEREKTCNLYVCLVLLVLVIDSYSNQ